MTGSVALDVVIGLVFVYLLYSLLVTILHEAVSNLFSFRGKFLEKAIIRMLEDDDSGTITTMWIRIRDFFRLFTRRDNLKNRDFTRTFYNHPSIKYLGEDERKSKPSYITSANFSKTLIDLLLGNEFKAGQDPKIIIESALYADTEHTKWVTNNLSSVTINEETLSYLRSLWAESQGDVQKFKGLVENWFDTTMERATGWYKKHTQLFLAFIGLVVAIVFNVDTIKMTKTLANDPDLREQMVKQADNYLKTHKKELDQSITWTEAKKANDFPKLNELAKDSANFLSVVSEAKQRVHSVDSLFNADIKKVNQTMGLGWHCVIVEKKKDHSCKYSEEFCFSNLSWWSPIGWIITAMALSLGAPFWFDLLNKLMKLRGSVASTEKS